MKQTKQYLAARDRFHNEVVARGGRVRGEYFGSKSQVHVLCALGHDCYVIPSNLTKPGRGLCQKCAGRDKGEAAERFASGLLASGWTQRGEYVGAHKPVEVTCDAGHESHVTPGNFRAGKRCRICAGNQRGAAEGAFLARLAEEGGRLIGEYTNASTAVTCMCAAGHVTDRTPDVVTSRKARCRLCEIRHDVFYIVKGPSSVKFGISQIHAWPARKAVHARDGYRDVVRVWSGLPGDTAYELETELKRQMALARVAPVRGREYFPAGVLGTVEAFAADWLS